MSMKKPLGDYILRHNNFGLWTLERYSNRKKQQEPCCRRETARSRVNFDMKVSEELHAKAVLSQRWQHKAPYTWALSKFSGLPDYAHGYYSQNFSWAFVPIDPMNVPTKFEIRSFIRSRDNRGYPKNLGSPWIRPRSIFSKILTDFYSEWSCKYIPKFEVRSFTCSRDKGGS